jgi:CRP-like cAMP-binding protein
MLAGRIHLRAERLAYQIAMRSIPGVIERVETILWHYGSRWGRVTKQGVRLELPGVTQSRLAQVAATSRPSVSAALQSLRRSGAVVFEPPHAWMLRAPADQSGL